MPAGTIVGSGSLVSPGGQQGIPGVRVTGTVTTASFVIPATGNTVSVSVNDTSWMTPLTMLTFGSGWGSMAIQSVTDATHVVLYDPHGPMGGNWGPVPGYVVPSGTAVTFGGEVTTQADSQGAGLLDRLSGNATDFVDGTNNCQDLVSAITPVIWNISTRSFNAIGNPSFEIDQRNAGALVSNPTSGTLVRDRWAFNRVGSHVVSATRQAGYVEVPNFVPRFALSQYMWRYTLTTAQASLAAGDQLSMQQMVEGIVLREMILDVTSVSLLVRSSVAGLKFCISMRDEPISSSLVKLCTIPAANIWTLIQLPNIPKMTGTNFGVANGSIGYYFNICFAAGSNLIAPATDTWQSGSFIGATGMSNFVGQAVNSTIDIGFVQHEPNSVCTQFIDKPWQQNYEECLRYYSKSTNYGSKFPDGQWFNIGNGMGGNNYVRSNIRFVKTMAKAPVVRTHGNTTALNNVYYDQVGALVATNGPQTALENGINSINLAAALSGTVSGAVLGGWDADTGW